MAHRSTVSPTASGKMFRRRAYDPGEMFPGLGIRGKGRRKEILGMTRSMSWLFGIRVLMLAPLLYACDPRSPRPDGGADAADNGSDAATFCGDPVVRDRLTTCRQTTDANACTAAGGTWRQVGLSPNPTCVCPTGNNIDCPCTRRTDCVTSCRAPVGTPHSCDGITTGTCTTEEPSVGCFCWFSDTGEKQAVCVD